MNEAGTGNSAGAAARRGVVTLGMHRSGTSAITRGLEVLGVGLGGELMVPHPTNPKGFWEDRVCAAINERILAAHALHWSDLIGEAGFDAPEDGGESLVSEAIALVRARLAESPVWGFKDPRTCRALPFWRRVLAEVDAEVLYLIVIRNPLSVAESLRERDRLPTSHAFLLWGEHLVSALEHTCGCRRIVVDFDLLLAEPLKQLDRIARAFALPRPASEDPRVAEYCAGFLEAGLRHHLTSSDSLYTAPGVPESMRELYVHLRAIAEDAQSLDSETTAVVLRTARAGLETPAVLREAVRGLIREIRLQRGAAETQAARAAEAAELAETLDKTLKEARVAAAESERCIEQLNREIARLSGALEARDQSLQQILVSRSWSITRPLRALAAGTRGIRKGTR